ncbi:transporter [Sinomicrobium soli]|nr:outer membrane protein transport protein [Sinomicrobium sp. N-1-3-6]RAV30657.1 transporter [Sinomicrobium sp. N-1-3-6]
MKRTYISVMAVLITACAYAGGYRVALQGQKQLAMGHTGVAVINSAESVFFNPGGISFLEKKVTISAGVSPVISNIHLQNSRYGWSEKADNPVATPFNVYAAVKINDWMSAGIAVYTPYGSGVEYPKDWEGSHLINNIELQSIYIQPTVSFRINDKLSIGGGPILAIGSANFNRNIDRTTTNAEGERANVTIDDSGVTAWGYSLGLAFRATDDLTLGVSYKSEMKMKAKDGKAEFRNLPSTALGDFDNTTFNATLPLPAELAVGASYTIDEKWMVAFDYNRVYWDAYESLDVFFSNGQESHNPRNYKNSSVYRFGLQYIASERFTLRGGYYYDESPVQPGYFAPETPRNDSNNFTGGLTVNISERFAIDAAFLYIHFDEVDATYDHYQENGQNVPFGGTYKNNAFVPSIGVSYAF